MLYFDSTNVDVKRRHEALTRIRDSLHDLQPNDRAMVIAVEGGSVTEVQEFTTEPQLIDWALDRVASVFEELG